MLPFIAKLIRLITEPRRQSQVACRVLYFCLALLPGCFATPSSEPEPIAAYRQALARFGISRPTLPRLSIDGVHQPCPREAPFGDYRCPALAAAGTQLDARLARTILSLSAGGHAKALAPILFGTSPSALDRSIELLEPLVAADPAGGEASTAVAVDLSAVLLARFELTQDPEDLLRAIEVAGRARRAPTPEPRLLFNLALAASKLQLGLQARELWRAYADQDPSSGWAEEARARAAAIRLPDADSATDLERALALPEGCIALGERVQPLQTLGETILDRWAQARVRGDASGDRAVLERAATVGGCLRRLGRERQTADQLLRLDQAPLEVAAAFAQLAEGRNRYQATDYGGALPILQAAGRRLAAEPFQPWARFWAAAALINLSRYEEAIAALDELTDRVDGDPALRGRALGIRGLAASRLGRNFEALQSYRQAVADLDASGRQGHRAWAYSLLAENLGLLGQPREALGARWQALQGLALDASDPSLIFLFEAARATLGEGKPHAAEYFVREAMARYRAAAAESRSPLRPPMLALLLAEALAAQGRHDGALEALDAGDLAVGAILDEEAADRTGGLLRRTRALILAEVDPRAAVALLEPVIAGWQVRGARFELIELLTILARAQRRLGNEQAQASLEAALVHAEALRGEVGEDELHRAYASVIHEPFDLRVAWDLEAGDSEGAATALERRRSFAGRDPEFSLPSLREALRDGQAVLQFARRGDSLAAWCLMAEGLEFRETRLDLPQQGLLAPSASGVRDLGSQSLEALHRLLLGPFPECVGRARDLIFVVDPILEGVPLAALLDARTHRYLVEDHAIASVVSLSQLMADLAAPHARRGKEESLLLVGASESPAAKLLGLGRLEGVDRELSEIATLFPKAVVLDGPEATAASARRAIRGRSILHFSGHATSRPAQQDAVLYFAAGEDELESSAVSARQLARWPIQNLDLVFLAGCTTADARAARADGIAPFVEALLGAGARTMVGALWKLEDDLLLDLSVEFYRRLRAGERPAEALRQSQLLELARNRGQARIDWAALQIYGSGG
jgi:tetratricopeptide (TPR) repeat protein